jgi:hypothetical protein
MRVPLSATGRSGALKARGRRRPGMRQASPWCRGAGLSGARGRRLEPRGPSRYRRSPLPIPASGIVCPITTPAADASTICTGSYTTKPMGRFTGRELVRTHADNSLEMFGCHAPSLFGSGCAGLGSGIRCSRSQSEARMIAPLPLAFEASACRERQKVPRPCTTARHGACLGAGARGL